MATTDTIVHKPRIKATIVQNALTNGYHGLLPFIGQLKSAVICGKANFFLGCALHFSRDGC